MNPARGSLLGIEHLEAAEILRLLKFARRMNPDKPRPLLKGKRVLLLFYEASTRTRSSFEIAAKLMGAHTVLIQSMGSSIEKGESLLDTGYTVRALGADIIVIRHPNAGAPPPEGSNPERPRVSAMDRESLISSLARWRSDHGVSDPQRYLRNRSTDQLRKMYGQVRQAGSVAPYRLGRSWKSTRQRRRPG